VVATVLVAAIGVLVAKPWTWRAVAGSGALDGSVAVVAASPSPTTAATSPSAVSPDLVLSPDASPVAAGSPPPSAYVENLEPIQPDRWAHLSATLRSVNADGVVLVARYPGGLYYGFLPATPSESATIEPPEPDGTSNSVRVTSYLANPIAIGITRPTDTAAPLTVAWQVLGPGRQYRLTLRHPVGDLDRYLFLGPGLGLPPGERRNRREISRWPPAWQAGVYRFDIASGDGLRHVFVILEP
jgi:hypothetical protein